MKSQRDQIHEPEQQRMRDDSQIHEQQQTPQIEVTSKIIKYCCFVFFGICLYSIFAVIINLPVKQYASDSPVINQKLSTDITIQNSADNEQSYLLQIKNQLEFIRTNDGPLQFKKVVWVQTEDELASQTMLPAISAQNIIHFSKLSGYEVRIVDNLNAYDWLSPQMVEFIRFTHHRSRVDFPVYQLLRLALLIEHGGISIKLPNIILLENIDWVERIFKNQGSDTLCKLEGAELFMFQRADEKGVLEYKQDIIAAVKQSRLLIQVFDEMSRIVINGQWPYSSRNITTVDRDSYAKSFPYIIQALVNIKMLSETKRKIPCLSYKLQSIQFNKGVYSMQFQKGQHQLLLQNMRDFQYFNGKKYLIKGPMQQLVQEIASIIKTGNMEFGFNNSTLKNKIMMAEGNQWLTRPANMTRDVHFCIISLKQQTISKIYQQSAEQISRLQKQTYKNWNLVHFVRNFTDIFSQFSQSPNLTIVNASEYEGLNLQRAATKYCDPKSVGLLLDYDEQFPDLGALQDIANEFRDKQVFGAFINLKTPNKTMKSSMEKGYFRRWINQPNIILLNEISNLFRVFTIESYRFIAHFDLYHSSGRYFNRQIALQSMLEIGSNFEMCLQGSILYQVRRLQNFMDIPIKRLHLNVFITSHNARQVNLSYYQYSSKLRYHEICEVIYFYEEFVAPVETMAVFNDGYQFLGIDNKIENVEESKLIPKKIHQIWVTGQIPKFKQILMNKMKELHPDYEYYLWSDKNLTRQNFPNTFDMITKLLQFDKISPYNKMASVSDLMRNQIIYMHGGFYADTNYMIFKSNTFDSWRKFDFVTGGQISQRQRMFKDNAIFGAVKGYQRMFRVINHKALSNRRIFSNRAAMQTGPGFFGKVIYGKEQLDPKVLQPGFQQLYPNFIYDNQNINGNFCEAPQGTPTSQILFTNTLSYVNYCDQLYPYAFGLDFFSEGLSWNLRRW